MMNGKKVVSIMNMPGNSYTLFTFHNLMYTAGLLSKKNNEKVLFIDLDLTKAEFSRSFKTQNMSKLLSVIDKYKSEFIIDKEEILKNIVENPVLTSGVVMENVSAFLITGNIPRIAGFMKFDIKF